MGDSVELDWLNHFEGRIDDFEVFGMELWLLTEVEVDEED